jgi:hypothetical protein
VNREEVPVHPIYRDPVSPLFLYMAFLFFIYFILSYLDSCNLLSIKQSNLYA